MEFEDMQLIWNEQNEEKQYVINEAVLYEFIKSKGQKVHLSLEIFEWAMIGANLMVSIILTVDAVRDAAPLHQYIMAALYMAFSVGALLLRLRRRTEEKVFEQTMLGEIDKAIWKVNYLIRQSERVMMWYIMPLLLVFLVSMYFQSDLLWGVGTAVLALTVAHFGGRWEINRCYLPRKRELEELRHKLIEMEE